MKMNAVIALMLAGFLITAVPLAPAYAFQGEQDRALELRKERDLLPYREIEKRAERQFDGRVVGQRLKELNGRMIYELRILGDDGKVIVVLFDAKTGRVIGTRGR